MTFTTRSRKLFTTLGLAGALALAVSAPAPGATTFGANLSTIPTTGAGTCPLGAITSTCAYVPQSTAFSAYVVPSNGVITRFRVRTAAPGGAVAPVYAKVVREVSGSTLRSVATSTSPLAANITGIAEANTRMKVQAGDVLGLEFGTPSGPVDPTLPYVFVDTGVSNIWLLEPSIADGNSALAGTDSLRPLVAADLEADADNDGFGDESQDACPAIASRQSAPCVDPPAVPVVPATAACKVPKLKGLTKSKAKAALIKASCKLGKTTRKKSKSGKKGRAMKQSPAAGTLVPAGTAVKVTLKK